MNRRYIPWTFAGIAAAAAIAAKGRRSTRPGEVNGTRLMGPTQTAPDPYGSGKTFYAVLRTVPNARDGYKWEAYIEDANGTILNGQFFNRKAAARRWFDATVRDGAAGGFPRGRFARQPQVAALYVDPVRGPYGKMAGVDAWGWERNAKQYKGPHPVIAHPACGSWGRFWWRYTGKEGDAACALTAVKQVRKYGGVLEHPAMSNLWDDAGRYSRSAKRTAGQKSRPKGLFDLPKPGEKPDRFGGYSIAVNQSDWGHPARKATWLYIVGVPKQELPARPPPRAATHTITTSGKARGSLPELTKSKRHLTPPKFAAWLKAIAVKARVER